MEHSTFGKFLVAETDMEDPNFVHSVILMVQHDATGAFGLVINDRSEFRLDQVSAPKVSKQISDFPLYHGGPVERQFLFALRRPFPSNIQNDSQIRISENLIFDPHINFIEKTIGENHHVLFSDDSDFKIRFYSGYSGWGPRQLDKELEEGAWVVVEANDSLVFENDMSEAWVRALKAKGGAHWAFATTGYKPSMN